MPLPPSLLRTLLGALTVLLLLRGASGAPVDLSHSLASLLPLAHAAGLAQLAAIGQALLAAGSAPAVAAFKTYLVWRLGGRLVGQAAAKQRVQGFARRAYRRVHTANRRMQQINWQQKINEHMSDAEFKNAYGLSRATFDKLIGVIGPAITDSPGGWGGVRSSEIMSPEVKLAMTLRW